MPITIEQSRNQQALEANAPGLSGVLPHAVVRVAGVPHRAFQRLLFSETSGLILQLLDLEHESAAEAGVVLSLLERAIGLIKDVATRRDLISLRRSVFNDRCPAAVLVDRLRAPLATVADGNMIFGWIERRVLRDKLAQVIDSQFTDELRKKRGRLAKILHDPGFGKALAIASPSLSAELDSYVQSVAHERITRSTRAERSFMNYLCRSAFKLSPFSSFTSSGLAHVYGRSERQWGQRRRVRRHVAMNQALISTVTTYIMQHADFEGQVPVYLSRAVIWGQDTVRLLRHSYDYTSPNRSRIPREALLTVPAQPVLRLVKDLLNEQALRTDVLRRQVDDGDCAKEPDHDIVTLLSRAGLIRHYLIGSEPGVCWETLLEFLACSPATRAPELYQLCSELKRAGEQFPNASAAERRALLKSTEEIVLMIYGVLGKPYQQSWSGLLFYEDSVDSTARPLHEVQAWRPAADDLQELVTALGPLLDGNASARDTAHHILATDFAGKPTPLLEFMEHYSRSMEVVAPSSDSDGHDYTPNSLALPSLQALAAIRREFGRVISETSAAEEVDFRQIVRRMHWQERVGALDLTPPVAAAHVSTCYCQPVRSLGQEQLVLNKLHAGPFRAVLRICSALARGPEKDRVLKELHDLAAEVYKDADPCEVHADFDFNVNCQPGITDTVINYAGRPDLGTPEFSVADLMLEATAAGKLRLWSTHDPDRNVIPLTFGLMATVFQPPVQYLLLSLGVRDPFVYRPFDPFSWDAQAANDDKILAFPRLLYGKCIVRRRGWALPRRLLPQRECNERDSKAFARVQRWKRQFQLPDEVFVRARRFDECMQGPDEHRQKKRTLHKPQYIHFGNYFLVESFFALCKECTSHMYFEEALPRHDDWEQLQTRRALEYVLDIRSDRAC
jgi:hypothetical protein